MLFSWIKTAARNAVLAGVNEALAELSATPASAPALPTVTLLLPYAGPEPTEDAEVTRPKSRKAN